MVTFQPRVLAFPPTQLTGMLISCSDVAFRIFIAVHLTFLVQPVIRQYLGVLDGMQIKCPVFNSQVIEINRQNLRDKVQLADMSVKFARESRGESAFPLRRFAIIKAFWSVATFPLASRPPVLPPLRHLLLDIVPDLNLGEIQDFFSVSRDHGCSQCPTAGIETGL